MKVPSGVNYWMRPVLISGVVVGAGVGVGVGIAVDTGVGVGSGPAQAPSSNAPRAKTKHQCVILPMAPIIVRHFWRNNLLMYLSPTSDVPEVPIRQIQIPLRTFRRATVVSI